MTFLPKARSFAIAIMFAGLPAVAQAQAITPAGVFGAQPTMTFGGTGIPNNAVMVNGNMRDLTLGLTAHQRLVGPNLLNNGNGVFYASTGNPFASNPTYAAWNVGFYVGGSGVSNYNLALLYDFNPASGNAQSTHGVINFTATGTMQDSYNMGMAFLGAAIPGSITPPSYTPFDPNAAGQYTFALAAYDKQTGAELSRAAIEVDASSVVPEPSTYALMAAGLAALGLMAKRRKSAIAAATSV